VKGQSRASVRTREALVRVLSPEALAEVGRQGALVAGAAERTPERPEPAEPPDPAEPMLDRSIRR
jgi:hypothetical protein